MSTITEMASLTKENYIVLTQEKVQNLVNRKRKFELSNLKGRCIIYQNLKKKGRLN